MNAARKTVWASAARAARAACLVMQSDGNLAIRQAGGPTTWQTKTSGNPGAVLKVQDDGNVAVVRGGSVLWSTGTFEPDPITKHFPREEFQKLPALNRRILLFANEKHGRRVRDGDCWQFVDAARASAGARKFADPYVFGRAVTFAQAVPGDMVQFKGRGIQHSAILWGKNDDGSIVVIHANSPPNGKNVGRLRYDSRSVNAFATFYRPVN